MPVQARSVSLRGALFASALVHLGAIAGAAAWAWASPAPPAERIMVAKLVRLGPPKPKDQLPDLQTAPPPEPPAPEAPIPPPEPPPAPEVPAPPPPPPPAPAAAEPPPSAPAPEAAPPAPSVAPIADAAAASKKAAANAARATRAALNRLKRKAHGSLTGSTDGDADEAEAGNIYAGQIKRCVEANYRFEGVEEDKVMGRRAVMVVFIQADGRISRHRLTQSSGLPAFDQAVSRAVRLCAKQAPPPPVLAARLRQAGLEIEFSK